MKPNCRRICDLLAQYADGTLPDSQRGEVQRHLDACPPCRVIAGKECGARQLLRACADRLRTEPLPPGLRTRCQALAGEQTTTRAWLRPSMRFAIAALLILLVGALLSIVTRQSDALLAAQLTADHIKCFGLFRPTEGKTLDAEQAQKLLSDRFGLDVHVPPSSGQEDLSLLNARTCLYADGRIPHLMYEANGQDLSLFVLEGETRAPAELTAFGHHTRIWSRGGNTFVLITPAAEESVADAARYVAAEAH
ncbi:MAG TPA: zf-HC2 domain-containing protein [Vicinamibacterales bacterium]|jgi:anti-sigma factor (TIGR02949 family)|nr:zf-HC2 domain-containing protein [Vicinamibacterales bacterium]